MMAAFDWSCLLLTKGYREVSSCTGDPFHKLVEAQSCLYTSIMASKSKKITDKAQHR